MPKAVLEEVRCHPQQCNSGICIARKLCPVKAIWQEQPYETPFISGGRCNGCSRCVEACLTKAFRLS